MLYTCKYQFENISLYLVATETHLINIQFTQPQKLCYKQQSFYLWLLFN